MRRTGFFLGLAICAGSTAGVQAQSNATDAAMSGYVTDSSEAAVPGAEVKVTKLNTGTVTTTVTDSQGHYRFYLLPIGVYALEVKATGFSGIRQDGITLEVGSEVSVNERLSLGPTQSKVQVNADASILQTDTPAVGATLNEVTLRALPIVSRNIYNLYLFSPGVIGTPVPTFGFPSFTFGGVSSTAIQMDGLDNTQRNIASPIRLVINTPEAIAQTEVLANGYAAEFGRTAGGIINAVSRGGTNQLHGGLFTLYRPNATKASPAGTTFKPSSKWQTYEGSLGGPIVRDRLFFFANFEYTSQVDPVAVTITPANAAALGLTLDNLGSSPKTQAYPTASVRADYTINSKNHAFLRWNSYSNDIPNNSAGGLVPVGFGLHFHDKQQSGEAQLATTLSSTLLNEFRFGTARRDNWSDSRSTASQSDVLINISSVANIGNSQGSGSDTTEKSIEVVDNVTKSYRSHLFKAGIDYQNTNDYIHSATPTTYTFSNLANYLSTKNGTANAYQQVTFTLGNPQITNVFQFFNAFLQDEYLVNHRLTLDFGVRYELIRWPELDQNAPYSLSRQIRQSNLNLAPRLGLSYNVNSKTMLHAASGVYFDTPNLTVFNYISQSNGDYLRQYSVSPTTKGAPTFPVNPNTATSTATVPNVAAYDPNYRDMYAIQSNLQIERELTTNLSVAVQYLSSLTRKGPYSHDVNLGPGTGTLADGRRKYSGAANRPITQFNEINLITSGSNTNYNGLFVTLRKRMSHGLVFSTSYGWSKALGTNDQANTSQPVQTFPTTNLRADYGLLSSDVRHNWVLQGAYTPMIKGRPLVWLDAFQLSTMTYVHSGNPINPYAGSDLNNDQILNDRPLFSSRNSVVSPALYQEDMRLGYTFPGFFERYHLELFSEATNLFNHPSPNCTQLAGCSAAIQNNVTSPQYLHIISYVNPRGLQFGGRLNF